MPLCDAFVDVEGVMEVHTLVENPCGGEELLVDREHEPPVDMLRFQQTFRPDRLPDDFCQKDRYTGKQKIFFCLVCEVGLKSPSTLDSHVRGQKHAKKVLELKRRRLGITEEEDRVGKQEKKKKERKPATKQGRNTSLFDQESLQDHLEKDQYRNMPLLGLEFIEEYQSESRRDNRQYTCTIEADGCKGVWGTSYDMVNHLCGNKMKHNRNYLVKVAKVAGAESMTKDKLFEAAKEEEIKLKGPGRGRDYDIVMVIRDQKRYEELASRSQSFNPKKVSLEEKLARKRSMTEQAEGANLHHPLVKRPRDRSLVEKEWDQANAALMIEKLDKLQMRIEHLLELIKAGEGGELKEFTTEALKQFKFMVDVFQDLPNACFVRDELRSIVDCIPSLEIQHDNIMDEGTKRFNALRQRLERLQTFVKGFAGSETDDEYKANKKAIESLEVELRSFKPADETMALSMATLAQECRELLKELDGKAGECLSALLENEFQMSVSKEKAKEVTMAEYRKDLTSFCWKELRPYLPGGSEMRLKSEEEAQRHLKEITGIIFEKEQEVWQVQGLPWEGFKFSEATQVKALSFIKKKMNRLPALL